MDRTAHLFPTCLVNELYPQVGFAVAELLRRQGWAVKVPALPLCCGQPAYNSGELDQARAVARTTLRAFADGEGPVLLPSGSCADMLVHHLPSLFDAGSDEGREARRLASRVRELSQFLVDDLGVEDLGARAQGRVAYHPSCHLSRGLGIKEQPLRLLAKVQGIELVPFPGQEECCGFGGAFSATHDQLSGAMLEEKTARLRGAQPDWVLSCDMGCLMHLEGGFRRRGWEPKVRHLAQFLVEGLP